METITVRTSERGTFKRCPKKWYWAFVDCLKPHRPATALWFGSAIHEALADWYKKGLKRGPKHPADVFAEYLDGDRSMLVQDEDDRITYEDARELGIAMLNNYINYYDHDQQWDIIATEMTFTVKIKHPAGFMIEYVGTWDGVARDTSNGEIWLLEHKTAANINTEHLPLDDQAGSYWAVAETVLRKKGVLGPEEHIVGIMYNFLKKDRKDNRPVNAEGFTTNNPQKKHYLAAIGHIEGFSPKMTIAEMAQIAADEDIEVFGEPTAQQPDELLVREPVYRSRGEQATQIQRIKDEALYMFNMRKGNPAYPVYKTPQQFGPMACARCEFFRLCQLDEAGDSIAEDLKETMFQKWEPYAAHDLQIKVA